LGNGMAKKLENIFNECLERMLRGESIESCLSCHPEEAAELEPLLRTALGVRRSSSSLQPRPEFKAWARARLEGAQLYAKQQRQPKRAGLLAWQQGWALALTAVLVILLAGAGTVAASSNALPDEPLYPVKLTTEQVRLAFTFSDAGEVRLHTQLAENRAMEIAAMARQGKTEQVAIVTEKLTKHLEKADYAIKRVEEAEATRFSALPKEAATTPELSATPEPEETKEAERLKEFVKGRASKNLAVLEDALEDAPEQAKPALQRAIEMAKKSCGKVQQETGAESEGKPIPVKPE